MDEKWIKIMNIGHRMGCHQMAERSFFYKGYQFPVCARCTGVIIASLAAIILFFIYRISIKMAVLFSGIMFLDWFIQYLGIKDSTNIRRLVTGLIGGYGFMTLQMYGYTFLIKFIIAVVI